MSLATVASVSGFWQHKKLACAVTFALVFLCGVAAGALSMRSTVHRPLHRDAFWTDNGKALYLSQVKKDLNLTPEQVQQMDSVLNDFAQYYRTVLSDGRTRIYSILNDDQKRKFDVMLQKK